MVIRSSPDLVVAEVAVDRSAFFTSDRVAVRVVLRVSFAFPHEQAVVKIVPSDPS
jgi:hypothetical protein